MRRVVVKVYNGQHGGAETGRPAYVSQNTTSSSLPFLISTCEARFPESDISLKQLRTQVCQLKTRLTLTGPHVMFAVTSALSGSPQMRVILNRITCGEHVNEDFPPDCCVE